ncbi:hypothetical protein BWI93_05305 [Siphonobacter sp. BAB-5385]|nr:hypothetical protein BWI93_05305 [Siphonobacter sp. BAB-5385]
MPVRCFIEYSEMSRDDLVRIRDAYKKNPGIKNNYVGLKGRRFYFEFPDQGQASAFMKAAEFGFQFKKIPTERINRDLWK